jgi:hypothetical protein
MSLQILLRSDDDVARGSEKLIHSVVSLAGSRRHDLSSGAVRVKQCPIMTAQGRVSRAPSEHDGAQLYER